MINNLNTLTFEEYLKTHRDCLIETFTESVVTGNINETLANTLTN